MQDEGGVVAETAGLASLQVELSRHFIESPLFRKLVILEQSSLLIDANSRDYEKSHVAGDDEEKGDSVERESATGQVDLRKGSLQRRGR